MSTIEEVTELCFPYNQILGGIYKVMAKKNEVVICIKSPIERQPWSSIFPEWNCVRNKHATSFTLGYFQHFRENKRLGLRGDRTRVSRVAGGRANHYTTRSTGDNWHKFLYFQVRSQFFSKFFPFSKKFGKPNSKLYH